MKIRQDLNDELVLKEIGTRLRALRVRSRLMQEELAESCGISRKSLMRLEAGEGGMRLVSFISVLRRLGCLHAFDVVLPEDQPTPSEVAAMERLRKPLPKTVRSGKSRSPSRIRWGDESC